MIVHNPLPPTAASMSSGRFYSPPDKTDPPRGEGIATAERLFMDAKPCCIDAARDAMRLTLGRQKAMRRIVV